MMGSTGDADRKRRHFNSISSPTAATAKKQPFVPLSEDKKLDTAVLKFQNKKLLQKLELQKVEHAALENKYDQLKEKQLPNNNILADVDKSWQKLVDEVDSCSIRTKDLLSHKHDDKHHLSTGDNSSLPPEDVFLNRLLEKGATESSSANSIPGQVPEDREPVDDKIRNVFRYIVHSTDGIWSLKDGLYASMKQLPGDGLCRPNPSIDLERGIENLKSTIDDMLLRHRSLGRQMQSHCDTDAKNKAELRQLKGELECTIAELEESNKKLAIMKAETDAAKGANFPILLGNKHVANDRAREKQKNLHDMESLLKDLLDQSSSRLLELQRLYGERIEILKQLSSLQNTIKNVKGISSSQAFLVLKDQIAKAKADVGKYQAMFEKLQVEKDNLGWREKEINIKSDVADVLHRSSAVTDSGISDLQVEIQKQVNGRKLIEAKLEDTSRDPGRTEIISEFRMLVSSFPEDMESMQTQLSKYKEAASDVHSLRADVQSLSSILEHKMKELESLTSRSAAQSAEIQILRTTIQDLEESDSELKLILDMCRLETTISRNVLEARNSEYNAWAHVHSLSHSLDDHRLELRVKTAIEAEATSQQRLAAAEAGIADLRQKLEMSKREKYRLSDVLKSKHELNEAYLSEIETIGRAYDDIQTQNQQLLQQITERDDYNIKLGLEGVRSRQLRDSLLLENYLMERKIQQGNALINFLKLKVASFEDQMKSCSDHVQKSSEDRVQNTITLEKTQKRLLDVRKTSQQLMDSLEESQTKVHQSRVSFSELQIELERERFDKKRVEEEIEAARRKYSCLRSQFDGSSVVEKLQQELKEYKEILKCTICLDRPKEVVITKCYHLFCNLCVQRTIESRHRKCPVCSASFTANDVKPVYI